jgi:transposase
MGTSAGIDWANSSHAVCIVDADGRPVAERAVKHDEAGLQTLIGLLQGHDVQRVAIERPDGVLVERVLEAGFVVLAVHPNQVLAARDRYRVGRAKSDPFDAFVLAELARTDAHRFRCIEPDSDATRALRAQTRAHQDLVRMRVAMTNRLRAELERCWPGPVGLFCDLDSKISLAFLAAYPAPQDAATLTTRRLARFLARQRYSGRRRPAELLAHLAAAPQVQLAPAEAAVRRDIVRSLVATLIPLAAQIRELDRAITRALRAHPEGHVFRSLFRSGDTLTAAELLAEIGDSRARYPTPDALASDAGQTPVTVQSGKFRGVVFRRACDKRLRNAMATLANSSRHHNPWAADIYHRAIGRGCNHAHALRILGRAWTRILWRCWHDHQPYDPTRHRGRQRFLTT